MAILRRSMPILMLGVRSADGRRFDDVRILNPVRIWLPVPSETGTYGGMRLDSVGRIVELVRGDGGRVDAVCEFEKAVDPALVLGADGTGYAEFECVEMDPVSGQCVDGLLAVPMMDLWGATLQPADKFLWPDLLV